MAWRISILGNNNYIPKHILTLNNVFILSGYIHADEFFQSQEIMARDLFGFSVYTPWEFQGDGRGVMAALDSEGRVPTAYRSVVPPAVSSGLPYLSLRWASDVTMSFGGSSMCGCVCLDVKPVAVRYRVRRFF